jgi:hypothetical protein
MLKMKKVLLTTIGVFLIFGSGCAVTQNLPSVTLGGDANKHSLVGLSVGKNGIGVVAPLVAVDIPCPKLKVGDK